MKAMNILILVALGLLLESTQNVSIFIKVKYLEAASVLGLSLYVVINSDRKRCIYGTMAQKFMTFHSA